MYKLSFKKRAGVVKQYLNGISASKLAMAQNMHRSAVYQIIDKYKQFSWDGLKDHKTGRSEIILNPNAIILILDLRKRFSYGPGRIEQILKQKGFAISHRQIEKVLIRNGMLLIQKSRSQENGCAMSFRTQMICGTLMGRLIILWESN